MYFSDIMKKIGDGNYNFEPSARYLFTVDKTNFKISFAMNYAAIIVGETVKEFNFVDFDKFQFTLIKAKNQNDRDTMTLSFNGEKLLTLSASKMEGYKELFHTLQTEFTDPDQCSPVYQMQTLMEEWNLDFSDLKEADTRKIIFLYKDKFENLIDNSFLDEGSKVLFFLEEHTGGIGNARDTVKKTVGKLFSGHVLDTALNVAKAGATRLLQNTASEIFAEKAVLILTDRTVLISSASDTNEYDFDEARTELKPQEDETLVGVIDICDDIGNKLLDNISPNDWKIFKKILKKLQKGEYGFSQSNEFEAPQSGSVRQLEAKNNEAKSDIDDIGDKLKKLKALLDEGILSDEEFTAKKQELLGLNDNKENAHEKAASAHRIIQQAIPPVQQYVPPVQENTNSQNVEKPKKKQKTWVKVLKWIGIIYLIFLAISFIITFISSL